MKRKVSFKVSLGGIVSALCLILMFMTYFMPILYLALPAIAGVLLVVMVVEINKQSALVTYVAVSILSLLIADKESAVLFIFFFGYYPIIKSVYERIKNNAVCWAVKILTFNISVIIAYKIIISVFGIVDILDEFSFFGQYGLLIILLLCNGVFVIYDIALTRLISTYINWFRPKFLRKVK